MPKTKWTSEQCEALERVKQDFSNWRENKTGRERIPDNLCDAAADLFHTWGLSINKIVRSLSLSHSTLKTKIHTHPPVTVKFVNETDPTSTFIEMDPSIICSDCVIEMEKSIRYKTAHVL